MQTPSLSDSLVSVIVPAYNAGPFIDDCLHSIRRQTHEVLEVLVIDDGSIDDTYKRAQRHVTEDGRLSVIRQANRGASAARNAGLRFIRGHFVTFFDADDVLYPESIERRLRIFAERPNVDVVYSDHQVVDANRQPLRLSPSIPMSDQPRTDLLACPCMGPQGVLLRREVVETVGLFDEAVTHGEDWDYWIRTAEAGKTFYHLREVLCEYRRHESNITLRTDLALESFSYMLKKHQPLRADKDAWRAWKRGMYGIYRNWHWMAWNQTPGLIAKLYRIVRMSWRHPALLAAFPFVAANAIAKRLSRLKWPAT